jgi:monovalent cation:H+ antiporter-2, CPA2 family
LSCLIPLAGFEMSPIGRFSGVPRGFERLKQNAVVGYLVAGILLGPAGIGFLHTIEQLRALAELGVALLLFTIGLEFSFRKLREMGGVAVIGGSFQILVTGGVAGWMALHYA